MATETQEAPQDAAIAPEAPRPSRGSASDIWNSPTPSPPITPAPEPSTLAADAAEPVTTPAPPAPKVETLVEPAPALDDALLGWLAALPEDERKKLLGHEAIKGLVEQEKDAHASRALNQQHERLRRQIQDELVQANAKAEASRLAADEARQAFQAQDALYRRAQADNPDYDDRVKALEEIAGKDFARHARDSLLRDPSFLASMREKLADDEDVQNLVWQKPTKVRAQAMELVIGEALGQAANHPSLRGLFASQDEWSAFFHAAQENAQAPFGEAFYRLAERHAERKIADARKGWEAEQAKAVDAARAEGRDEGRLASPSPDVAPSERGTPAKGAQDYLRLLKAATRGDQRAAAELRTWSSAQIDAASNEHLAALAAG